MLAPLLLSIRTAGRRQLPLFRRSSARLGHTIFMCIDVTVLAVSTADALQDDDAQRGEGADR